MTTMLRNAIVLLARILLSQIFIAAGVNHILSWGGTIKYMTAQGMAMEGILGGAGKAVVHIFLLAAVVLLLLGGLSILAGFRARLGAVLLIAFLVPATLIFHRFWTYDSASTDYQMQMMNFMKNTAMMGGILMILAHGAGGFSVDAHLLKRQAAKPKTSNAET
jgi:putative oxidoreductase